MKRKRILVAILIVFAIFAVSGNVFAGSRTISLYTNETSANTAWYEALYARASNVYNYPYSERDVYCILGRYNYYGGIDKVVNHLVDPSETYNSGWYEYVRPAYNLWQLELNPYGWATTGCRADGTLQYTD